MLISAFSVRIYSLTAPCMHMCTYIWLLRVCLVNFKRSMRLHFAYFTLYVARLPSWSVQERSAAFETIWCCKSNSDEGCRKIGNGLSLVRIVLFAFFRFYTRLYFFTLFGLCSIRCTFT